MRFENDLAAVERMYDEIDRLLEKPAVQLERHSAVSDWSASEQLQHVLISNSWALSSIAAMLLDRGDFSNSGRLNLTGLVVLHGGRMPRGRARAPAAAMPVSDIGIPGMRAQVQKHRSRLSRIRDNGEKIKSLRMRFRHPLLGEFTPRHGVRFMRVHTDHHLRIIRAILSSDEHQ